MIVLQLTGVKIQWLTKELCAVDGSWAEWGEWSRCSVLCGLGRRTRDRTCTDPFPSFGGRACPGPGTDLAHCFAGPCKGRSPFSSSSSSSSTSSNSSTLTWLTASLGPANVDLLLVLVVVVEVVVAVVVVVTVVVVVRRRRRKRRAVISIAPYLTDKDDFSWLQCCRWT